MMERQEQSAATHVMSVVNSTIKSEMPSRPSRYWAPMEGIQLARSTN